MKGNVTNTGYWPDSPDRNNDFNIIPSNNITMEGMDMPLLGVSNTGDKKLMMPGKNYKFKGESVIETPVDKGIFLGAFKQVGGQLVPHDISVPNLSRQNGGSSLHQMLQSAQNVYKPQTPAEPVNIHKQMNETMAKVKTAPQQKYYNPVDQYNEKMSVKTPAFEIPETYYTQLMQQENSIKKGFKDQKYYPYESLEGGNATVAYGHKLTNEEVKSGKYKNGLTEKEARDLMIQDVVEHKTRANESYDKVYGQGAFDKLSPEMKLVTVDFVYNGIPVSEFPKFFGATNDYFSSTDPEVRREAYNKMRQNSTRVDGNNKPLKSRNQFTESYLNTFPEAANYKPAPIASEEKMKALKNKAQIKQHVPATLRFQDGGDMPFGLPLKEQNIYALPEYNQPRNSKTGEILPDPQRPNLGMNTGATEYKYTYGMDNGDIDIPSIVAGQYIGDQALNRYMLTGDRFKTMADPGSYSKFYDKINELGIMQQKHGGSVKRVKIKSLPNNWKSQ